LRKGFTPAQRVDLTETVLFSSSNRVKGGSVKGSFRLSDLITSFRITVNAIDANGVIGYKQANIRVSKALYVNFDVPTTMTVNDRIKVSLKVGNLNGYSLNVKFTSIAATTGGINYTIPRGTFTLRSRTVISRDIVLTATNITQDQTYITLGVSAVYNGMTFEDSLTYPIKVLPKGFPRQVSKGGSLGSQIFDKTTPSSASFNVTFPKTLEAGSAHMTAKIFSSNFASLLSAVQALIQEPFGCFE